MNRDISSWLLSLGVLWPFLVPLLALGGATAFDYVVSLPLLWVVQLLSFPVILVGVIERFRSMGCAHWIAATVGLVCLGAVFLAANWLNLPVLGLLYL